MSSLISRSSNIPSVGEHLDIFILQKELHQGAMATLFLAEDPFSGRRVVVKIPCGDILNQPILFYHYQNEEQICRLVEHPGIISFIQRRRSRQYIIMEYVEGHDLRSMVGTNKKLELETALKLLNQLCEVATYLHEKGIVHLDLKPENIICLPDLTIKVIDFGLAFCRDLPDLLAQDLKNPQGTPWYIAPEQMLGERHDPRCDIYTMGMLFYEMLTGHLPWSRSSKLHVARKRLHHDPTPPRYYNGEIPPQIQDIILRAIARQSSQRYRNSKELQTELNNWQHLPVTATGNNSSPIPLWRRVFAFGRPALTKQQPEEPIPGGNKIIGAFIDSPANVEVVAELKKQALIDGFEVMLIHVIEEEHDSHVTRYGAAVEGEKLMAELEKAIQHLRQCGLDPSVRLIRGEAVEVLQRICREEKVARLVLGRSRKKEGLLRGASVPRRLLADETCPVCIAGKNRFVPLTDLATLQPQDINSDQILDCDIFLVDLWYEILSCHTEFIYQRFLFKNEGVEYDRNTCILGQWLHELEHSGNWPKIIEILKPVHDRFHGAAEKMIAGGRDLNLIRHIYQNESLPLSCTLKNELARVSQLLRSHLDQEAPPVIPFLADTNCPVTDVSKIGCGPLLGLVNLDEDIYSLMEKSRHRKQDGGN